MSQVKSNNELLLPVVKQQQHQQQQQQQKVKLCGYLKKKRNKVGGWRKLWFVLQDRLLLSYSSKEEYDNKLVSFKDVVSLVPGTMVRPLGGFRFTIETTTQALYTFHCDDRLAYREWMAMLLDSLGGQSQHSQHSHSSQSQLARTQTQNRSRSILGAQGTRLSNYTTSTATSVSMDSIPHVLLASSTSSSSSIGMGRLNAPMRWHQSRSSYDSISQLERVSGAGAAAGGGGGGGNGGGGINGGIARMPIAQPTAKLLERNGINTSQEFRGSALQRTIGGSTSDGKAFDLVKERIQRLSIRGTQLQQPLLQRVKLTATSSVEQVIMRLPPLSASSSASSTESNNNSKSCQRCLMETPPQLEPVYAVVDLQHKYAQRRQRNNGQQQQQQQQQQQLQHPQQLAKRCNSYESVQRRASLSLADEDDDIDGIYEDGDKLKPISKIHNHHNVATADDEEEEENIYEPINITSSYSSSSSRVFWKYLSRLRVKPMLQLSRLRTKRTTNNNNNTTTSHTDYDSIQIPGHQVDQPGGSRSGSGSLAAVTSTHLASIRRKFGTQRKSLRARMRKLCVRNYEPPPISTTTTTNNNTASNITTVLVAPNKKLHNRWRSVKIRTSAAPLELEAQRKLARRFFGGSLPLLRKTNGPMGRTRTSLFANRDTQQQQQQQQKPQLQVLESSR